MTPPLTVPTSKIPQNDNIDSASLIPAENRETFKFQRDDWMLFRTLGTLPQKAGVPLRLMRRLILKELVDNALDAGACVSIRQDGDRYIVEDDGPGIEGDPEDIAHLFSIGRPMVSSKLWRMPSRGALGNGLRVTAGAVLASEGELIVTTRNRRNVLTPRHDGRTGVVASAADMPIGTRIEIRFGDDLPLDPDDMSWGQIAIEASRGDTYTGKTSPFWYDADHFHEVLMSADGKPVRAFIEELDGCTGAKAGAIAADYRATPCIVLDREQAVALLGAARSIARPVSPRRLGFVGEDAFPGTYAIETGTVSIGARNPKADVPYVVESWAEMRDPAKDDIDVGLMVNRTPVAAEARWYKDKKDISAFGCGLSTHIDGERGSYDIRVNVISPVVPITTDGKEPDLSCFATSIATVVEKAIKKAKRSLPKPSARKRTMKEVILDNLDFAIAKNSDGGMFRFPMRNLYYVVREFVHAEIGRQLEYSYFETVITDYEDHNGDIPGMTRDPRGTLYTPHDGNSIPIGTASVSDYERPAWTFNKVLFIEKEGFFETLKAVQWPERYDCALLTSKGYSSRACRDLIDLLAADAEETLTVFCVHDADAHGSMIYQTLQQATRARGARKVEIINLGLEPWEAEAMGLQSDTRGDTGKDAPVADYVRAHPEGRRWAAWLQRERYELNAMSMPQFIQWLDGKMAEHGVEKVIPPVDIVEGELLMETESLVRDEITRQLLADAGIDDLVAEAMESAEMPDADEIEADLSEWLHDNPTDRWRGWVEAGSRMISGEALKNRGIGTADSAS